MFNKQLAVISKQLAVFGSQITDYRLLNTEYRLLITLLLFLVACQNLSAAQEKTYPTVSPPLSEKLSIAGLPATLPPMTATAVALTPPAMATPTLAPARIACTERLPSDDLQVTITKQYPISPGYTPDDLVSLGRILPPEIVWGELSLRKPAAEALAFMVRDMISAGLRPQILSAYRSYGEQAAAYAKWQAEQPWRADVISARPGSSEHQLGTTIDFGSPELAAWVGPDIQFHVSFSGTSEGLWLAEYAHEYGFTLSYPEDGFETTGFVYEPWHYRFVGVETATMLKANGRFLTEWQLENDPIPCLP